MPILQFRSDSLGAPTCLGRSPPSVFCIAEFLLLWCAGREFAQLHTPRSGLCGCALRLCGRVESSCCWRQPPFLMRFVYEFVLIIRLLVQRPNFELSFPKRSRISFTDRQHSFWIKFPKRSRISFTANTLSHQDARLFGQMMSKSEPRNCSAVCSLLSLSARRFLT